MSETEDRYLYIPIFSYPDSIILLLIAKNNDQEHSQLEVISDDRFY